MVHTVDCLWKKEMQFEAEVNGHIVVMDALEEYGGKDAGPRPKPLLLAALAGCTGMDVISILQKGRQKPAYFNIRVSSESTEEHPMYYRDFKIVYEFKESDNLDKTKVERAVELSQERYCGVSALFKLAVPVTWEIAYI